MNRREPLSFTPGRPKTTDDSIYKIPWIAWALEHKTATATSGAVAVALVEAIIKGWAFTALS